jgi:hypothetical protein
VQAVGYEEQPSKPRLGFLERFAERVALSFLADETPAKIV